MNTLRMTMPNPAQVQMLRELPEVRSLVMPALTGQMVHLKQADAPERDSLVGFLWSYLANVGPSGTEVRLGMAKAALAVTAVAEALADTDWNALGGF